MLDPVLIGLISTLLVAWLGSIEMRMRNVMDKLSDRPTRRQVSEEIEVRQESLKVLQQEIKDDIKEMRRSLEKLIEDR